MFYKNWSMTRFELGLLCCRKQHRERVTIPGALAPLPADGINHPDFRHSIQKCWLVNDWRNQHLTPLQQLIEFKQFCEGLPMNSPRN